MVLRRATVGGLGQQMRELWDWSLREWFRNCDGVENFV